MHSFNTLTRIISLKSDNNISSSRDNNSVLQRAWVREWIPVVHFIPRRIGPPRRMTGVQVIFVIVITSDVIGVCGDVAILAVAGPTNFCHLKMVAVKVECMCSTNNTSD